MKFHCLRKLDRNDEAMEVLKHAHEVPCNGRLDHRYTEQAAAMLEKFES